MHHCIEAHKAIITDLQRAVNYGSMGYRDALSQLDRAAFKAVEYYRKLGRKPTCFSDGMNAVNFSL
jgi:hypothetical protein